jgi:ABC-type nitrate/sulfonate/bicarbonate transport system substrate-binding protein
MNLGKRFRSATAVVAALSFALVASGCGGSDGSDSGSDSDGTPSLKIAVSAPVIALGAFWIADGAGLFEKHNVDVDVTSYSAAATMSASMASDQVDVGLTSVGFGMALPAKGIESPMIFGLYRSDWSEFSLIAGPDFTSFEDLAAEGSDCTVAQYTAGSTIYGYMEQLVADYGIECKRVKVASPSDTVSLVSTGQLDLALTYPYLVSKAAGDIKVVMDPYTATPEEGKALFPTDVLTAGVWATADAAENKREALEGFVAALREGYDIIQSSTPEELAEITHSIDDAWGATALEDITAQWELAQPKALNGEVSEEMWTEALDITKNVFESPVIDPDSPDQAYDAAVDMSYLGS